MNALMLELETAHYAYQGDRPYPFVELVKKCVEGRSGQEARYIASLATVIIYSTGELYSQAYRELEGILYN